MIYQCCSSCTAKWFGVNSVRLCPRCGAVALRPIKTTEPEGIWNTKGNRNLTELEMIRDNMNVHDQVITNDYAIYNGDCCEVIPALPDESIHLSIYSPPFCGLYNYSSSDQDMSNCRSKRVNEMKVWELKNDQ